MLSSSLSASPQLEEQALLPGGLVEVTEISADRVHFERLDTDPSKRKPSIGSVSGSIHRDDWLRLVSRRCGFPLDSLQG